MLWGARWRFRWWKCFRWHCHVNNKGTAGGSDRIDICVLKVLISRNIFSCQKSWLFGIFVVTHSLDIEVPFLFLCHHSILSKLIGHHLHEFFLFKKIEIWLVIFTDGKVICSMMNCSSCREKSGLLKMLLEFYFLFFSEFVRFFKIDIGLSIFPPQLYRYVLYICCLFAMGCLHCKLWDFDWYASFALKNFTFISFLCMQCFFPDYVSRWNLLISASEVIWRRK